MKRHRKDEEFASGTFTWLIENFSKLSNDKHYSELFTVGGSKWRILIRPKGSYEDNLSMYLGVAEDAETLAPGWVRYAHFSLTLQNQLDTKKSITKPSKGTKEFKENNSEWGFKSFLPLSELYDSSSGYLVNDICIVEAKVDVLTRSGDQGSNFSATMESSKKERKGQESSNVNLVQAADSSPTPKTPTFEPVPPFQDTPGSKKVCSKPTDDDPTDPSLTMEEGEVPTNPMGELMEFKSLGQIEKVFVPLLEEVCSSHPSMIECLHKRKREVSVCALTALGELLHFLKTTKAKDMNEDACVRLQNLWEDLQMFRFDVAWLEPCVQSALGMKRFLERARRVKRLRQDVDVLNNEKKRRSAALAVTDADLEVAKRDLEKEEEGFIEIDMETELGYKLC